MLSLRIRRLRRKGPGQDDGNAVVLVLGTMMILAALAITSMAYAVASQKYARHSQDWSAALAAAQAGVDDYVSRLNRSDTYYLTTDCSNVALQAPATCSTPLGWQPVDGQHTATTDARYHYSVDTSNAGSQGALTVTSTGRVNGTYRSVQATLSKAGSNKYVYYTDFEVMDPKLSGTTTTACGGGTGGFHTALHWQDGRSTAGCNGEIQFMGADTINGQVFTNDTIQSTANNAGVAPTFTQQVYTGNSACATAPAATGNSSVDDTRWSAACLRSGSTAHFSGFKPLAAPMQYLPDNTSQFSTYPGCHYYGSVRIVFNANGTMQVWNKKLNNNTTAPVAVAASGVTPSCGSLTDLDSSSGATVTVPDGMVVYAAAATGSYSTCAAANASGNNGQLGGPTGRTLPLANDSTMTDSSMYCQQPNVYVEGTLKGRLTVAAVGSVVITGDLLVAGGVSAGSADVFGLVAGDSVQVFHPWVSSAEVSGWPTDYDGDASTLTIQAAVQALAHSFRVQNHDQGSVKGTLKVQGSIAQRWRGPVGTSNSSNVAITGYTKAYSYDSRLALAAPPYFPSWVGSQWGQAWWGETTTPASLKS